MTISGLLPPATSAQLTRQFSRLPQVGQFISAQSGNPSLRFAPWQVAAMIQRSYLVHITGFVPRHGKILARSRFGIPSDGFSSCGQRPSFPSDLVPILEGAMSIVRPTVHFSLNGVAPEHREHRREGVEIVVMERAGDVSKEVSGGYLEDIFVLGSHTLAEGSIVIVPDSYKRDRELASQLATLPRTLRVVDRTQGEKIEMAVKRVLAMEGVEGLSPASVRDSSEPIFVFTASDSKKALLSTDYMQALKRPMCTHDITPMAQIERMLMGSPVLSGPPFLSSLLPGYQETQRLIKEYISATSQAFPEMNEHQKDSLRAYESSLLLMLDMFNTSKSISELQRKWSADKARIQEYDKDLVVK